MSSWRILTQALYAIGGRGRRADFDPDAAEDDKGTSAALTAMRQRGIAKNNGKRGSGCVWWLTARGIDLCEGRIEWVRPPDGSKAKANSPRRFRSTWLSSLPRGIRITQRPKECTCTTPSQ